MGLAFSACKSEKEITSLKEFNSWMYSEKSGLLLSKSVNGIKVKLTYLTPEYNALKEMEQYKLSGKVKYDSLLTYYKSSATFVMTLAPDESKNQSDDIMYKGLKNYQEYVKRALSLNFDLEQQVIVEADGKKYMPNLSSLDNTYGLSNDRKINFVFTPQQQKDELEKASYYDFVYHDEQFDLGTLHFYFNKKEIENSLPKIVIK